jgi:F-type H+-transporting ATPase subunit b
VTEHGEASAVAEHGADHAPHHAPHISELVLPALNFALFAALLVWKLRGPIVEYFRDRTERIRDALAAGTRARAEAAALEAEIARDLAALPALSERIRSDLRSAAEGERDQLVAQGHRTAERLRADAKLLADQEALAAMREVRREVAEEAVREATALVRGALGPDDQQRFVREFVQSAGTAAGASA